MWVFCFSYFNQNTVIISSELNAVQIVPETKLPVHKPRLGRDLKNKQCKTMDNPYD